MAGRLLPLTVSCMLIGCIAAAEGDTTSVTAAWDSPRSFTLVYNVNNSGYIDVCGCKHKEIRQGSITRRASFLKQFRSTGRQILLLDGGSSLFPVRNRVKDEHRVEAIRKAELIIEAYNRMGYRAMAVGPFDMGAGLDTLLELEKKAKFSLLSANLYDENGKRIFKPYEIFEVGGIRVGVFGLTLDSLGKPFRLKVCPNADLRDPKETAREMVAELRGKVDLLVALSHIREEMNFELAKELAGLDVLLDPYIQYGNHHTWIKEEEWLSMHGETVFLRTDGQGARLGALDVTMKAPNNGLADINAIYDLEDAVDGGNATDEQKASLAALRTKNAFEFTRISIEPHHLTDPEIDNLISEWKNNVDPAKVARAEATLPQRDQYLTVTACQSCHKAQHAFWEKTKHANALASLVATADQHRFDCIGCHSLGYGNAFLDTTNMASYANVQCESCHGTNPKHAKAPLNHAFEEISKKTCLACHNKAQTLKDFNFVFARRQIACPKG